MKIKTMLAAMVVFFGVNVFAAGQVLEEKEVQVGLSGAYIPGGFDSASDVYVVVNGVFQNGCYKWKRADVDNVDTFNHVIKSVASVSQGACIMVLIPFQKEVHLGKFATGKHNLKFENGDGTYFEKTMVIE
ncbi:MAG TPA: hypothetical protein VN132_14025 [Bdellovibrio sp.]|nr:hypothetical protein [Bdellovibrio sp.]